MATAEALAAVVRTLLEEKVFLSNLIGIDRSYGAVKRGEVDTALLPSFVNDERTSLIG